MQPIGSLIVGLLAHITSAPFTLLIEGAAVIVSILLFIPSFKKTGKRAERKEKRLKKSSAKSMPS